jgi:hypothetical protein
MPGKRQPHRKMAADGASAENAYSHGRGDPVGGYRSLPHPEVRRLRRVSKDEIVVSWFETAQERLLTMRSEPSFHGLALQRKRGSDWG